MSYADLPLIDGTAEIKRIDGMVGREGLKRVVAARARAGEGDGGGGDGVATPSSSAGTAVADAVPFEGALVSSRPFLFPLPVAVLFGKLFSIATSSRVGEVIQ